MTRLAPILICAALLLSPVAAMAQGAPSASAQDRVMAAGYKALFLCGAILNGREAGVERTQENVAAREFVGIYPTIEPLMAAMPTEIGDHVVSVVWDPATPPRVALHRPGRSCAIQPVGYVVTDADRTPPPSTRRASAPDLPTAPLASGAGEIAEVLTNAKATTYGQGTVTTGVVVMMDGKRVAETYAPDYGPNTPQRTWSVAKSLAGTVIGAAVQRGEVDVNAPAVIANWQVPGDPRAAITVNDLMRMGSGLTSDTAGNRTDAIYMGGTAVDEQVASWPLLWPTGSRFRYANNDILLAVLGIAPTFADHPPSELFDHLGMTRTWAETDWRGNYVLSSQVWTTARDLARFGQLYLQDGMWEGERILPEGWLDYVSAPSGPQPQGGQQGYGATFWLMNRTTGVPADTISANGNRGQYVVIVPSRNIVIVRRGEDPAGSPFDITTFTRDVLAALQSSR